MSDALAIRRDLAERLADAAGEVILPYFRQRVDIADKGKGGFYDPVTSADRGAEQAIRTLLAEHLPEDGILGEEFGEKPGTSGYRWVLDPLDGTRAFIAGQPLWGTLIALEADGKPVLGVLDQPFLRERFVGTGAHALFTNPNGTQGLRSRFCARLADAVICTTHPMLHFSAEKREHFWRVEKACRLSRYGGDCYAYALLVMGFIDLVIEADLKRWDISAVIPIVEGAGGIVTDWSGRPAHAGGDVIAAGDARVHAEALKILNAG